MSDETLRELERRFRETGSVEDEAAWLRARVQAGDLTEERLRLSAFLGHEPAGSALGRKRFDPHYGKLQRVVLGTRDKELLTRFALAALQVAVAEPCSRPDLLPELMGNLLECERVLFDGAPGDHLATANFALRSLQIAHDLVVSEEVYEAVRAELVPWALGYSDPVRDRVDARQRAEAAGE